MDKETILTTIKPVLDKYDVPLALVEAIIEVESNFDPNALGDGGTSIGLFQLHKGGQADKAIAEGHTFESLADPLLNTEYAMLAIASAWYSLQSTFKADDFTWWLDFSTMSGHPGGSRDDPATKSEASLLQKCYNDIRNANNSPSGRGGVMDHIIPLPDHFQFVYQFQQGHSAYRCVAAVLAMAGQIAYPGRYQSPTALMSTIYSEYAGPDTPANTNGITKEQAIDWMQKNGVGYLDLAHLLDDTDALKHEIQAMNDQGVPVLLMVRDESCIKYAPTGARVHNWVDKGLSHCVLRVGYSDDMGWAYYAEPAASLAFPHPLPVMWQDIVDAGIFVAIGTMPHGVPQPPDGFSFRDNKWPEPAKPVINVEEVMSEVQALQQEIDNERLASDARFAKLLAELKAKA